MSATGTALKKDINNTIITVSKSEKTNDKAVFGVYSGSQYVDDDNSDSHEWVHFVNSVGEGCILITNFAGEVQNGDYITSSPIAGFGALQSDDLMHSYTVAKCTESIDWSTIPATISYNGQMYKSYLAACTYHCG